MEKVTFLSEGVECAAFLGLPEGAAGVRRPAIALGHGFGIRKESLIVEAEHLAAAGFVTLAIDYRTFGESGGEPRGSLFPLNEVEDFRNAITYLQNREDVHPDRIGIWGASFGGGVVIMTAVRLTEGCGPSWPWLRSSTAAGGSSWCGAVPSSRTFATWSKRTGLSAIRPGWEGGSSSPARRGRPCFRPTRGNRGQERSLAEFGRPLLEGTSDITIASVEKVLEWEPDRFIDRITPRPLLIVTPGQWDVMHRFEHTDPGLCPCRRAQEDHSPGVRTDGRLTCHHGRTGRSSMPRPGTGTTCSRRTMDLRPIEARWRGPEPPASLSEPQVRADWRGGLLGRQEGWDGRRLRAALVVGDGLTGGPNRLLLCSWFAQKGRQ